MASITNLAALRNQLAVHPLQPRLEPLRSVTGNTVVDVPTTLHLSRESADFLVEFLVGEYYAMLAAVRALPKTSQKRVNKIRKLNSIALAIKEINPTELL